jgi:hypothetical protein
MVSNVDVASGGFHILDVGIVSDFSEQCVTSIFRLFKGGVSTVFFIA